MDFFLISNMYPTAQYPGYGSFVKNISDELDKSGIHVACDALIVGKASGKFEKIKKYFGFYLSIIRNYPKHYDFIYIHFPNQAVPVLLPLLNLKKKKLVVNFHGEDLLYANTKYGRFLGHLMEKMCRKHATAIIVPSNYYKNILEERSLIDTKRIIVSSSGGINPNIFYPPVSKEFSNKMLHLGYVGRMEEDKGIIEFLYACNVLNDKGHNFKATAIGYGTKYEWAKSYIEEQNLSHIVTLISGVAQEKLGDFYRSFDLLIFSSSRSSESLGLTGIESMACGTPVIGSTVGGISSYLKDGWNGWLTPIHDVNSIVDKICHYESLSNKEKIILSNNCINTGKKYYSETVGTKLASELSSLLSE